MSEDIEDIAKTKGYKKIEKVILKERDFVMVILRTHLLTENLLEKLILIGLPRGDKVVEDGGLTYYQKLLLVSSLDQLPDPIISSLKNLNKVRNQCAHELDKKITEAEVTRIGSPLGKKFTDLKKKAKLDELVTLKSVLTYVIGFVDGRLSKLEHKSSEPQKSE